MAINFPSSPSVNDTVSSGGITWTWNGSSWEVTPSEAIEAIVDAKGDILVADADNSLVRLSAGTDGYFLKANSGATYGIEWASIPSINALDDVGDVNAPSPSDGQFLKYVSASSEWQAADIPTINALDDVGDVNAPSPSDGQFLKYVSASSEWQAADIPTINAIDDVGDVNAPSPSDNDVLRYDSTAGEWVNDPLTDIAPLASPTFTGTVTLPSTTLLPESYYNFTASATLTLATHQYQVIEANSSSAITITIPTNASNAWPVGTTITIIRVGTGEVTISPDSGVTLNNPLGNRLRAQWSTATIRKRATDTWLLSGDIKV